MKHTNLVRAGLLAAGAAVAAAVVAVATPAASADPAAAAPEVFAGFKNFHLMNSTTHKYTTNLNVPAGSYLIGAKLSAFTGVVGTNPSHVVTCTLTAGTNFDKSFTRLNGASAEAALSNTVVHTFPSAGTVTLECVDTNFGGSDLLEHIKITATRVNAVSDIAIP